MNASALRFETYRTGGSSETMLALGPKDGLQVIFVESFLEERNFLRRTVVGIARRLAGRGIGCVIPDLPGSGESLVSLEEVDLAQWRKALADAAATIADASGRLPLIASFRAGALIDDAADGVGWWRYAAASGTELLRPMRRAEKLGGTPYAGYRLGHALLAALDDASPTLPPGPLREAEVASTGAALWHRSEPTEDIALTDALSDDLALWVDICAAA